MRRSLNPLIAQGEVALAIHAIGLAALIALASLGRFERPDHGMAARIARAADQTRTPQAPVQHPRGPFTHH